jgi:tricarballylate dehydrogenase
MPPFYGYAVRPGITFTYLGLKTDDTAAVRFGGVPSANLFVGRRDDGRQRARQGLHGRRRHDRSARRSAGSPAAPAAAVGAPRTATRRRTDVQRLDPGATRRPGRGARRDLGSPPG